MAFVLHGLKDTIGEVVRQRQQMLLREAHANVGDAVLDARQGELAVPAGQMHNSLPTEAVYQLLVEGVRHGVVEHRRYISVLLWVAINVGLIHLQEASRTARTDIQCVVWAIDSLLVATASHHGLTMVTRNSKDFENLGLDILNPWND